MTTTPAVPADSVSTSVSAAPSANSERAVKLYSTTDQSWQSLKARSVGNADDMKSEQARAAKANKTLHDHLLASLQMQHLVVLAGSGTSLGPVVDGPSMWDLWDHCVNSNPGTDCEARVRKTEANSVIEKVGYVKRTTDDNIEDLLSQCEAYEQFKSTDQEVKDFLRDAKKTVLDMCSQFIDSSNKTQLEAHRTFLHRLSRRRVRDSRLKLFTTNYDLCFERAAADQSIVPIDGFSFSEPRCFDPRFFQYDIIRRTPVTGELGTPLEGVFHLLKLHGSVNWERHDDSIMVKTKPDPDKACMIYPAKGKYQQSYIQPHLELMSQYVSSLREPNTCVLTIGFGFNDDHLSEPLLAAVKTNPHIRLIIVSLYAEGCATGTDSARTNRHWRAWLELANSGVDVLIIDATFQQFATLIPDLRSLTAAEQLAKSVADLARGH